MAADERLKLATSRMKKMRYSGSMDKETTTWSTNVQGLKLSRSPMQKLTVAANKARKKK